MEEQGERTDAEATFATLITSVEEAMDRDPELCRGVESILANEHALRFVVAQVQLLMLKLFQTDKFAASLSELALSTSKSLADVSGVLDNALNTVGGKINGNALRCAQIGTMLNESLTRVERRVEQIDRAELPRRVTALEAAIAAVQMKLNQ